MDDDGNNNDTYFFLFGIVVFTIFFAPIIFQSWMNSFPIIISLIALYFVKITSDSSKISSQAASRAVTANVVDSIMKNYAKQEIFDAMRAFREFNDKVTNKKENDGYEKIIENRKILRKYFFKKMIKVS